MKKPIVLLAKYSRTYPKTTKNGDKTDMFVYHLYGSPEALALYKATKGEFYRTDKFHNDIPVWYGMAYLGEEITLVYKEANDKYPERFVPDTSHIAKARSLVKVYGGEVGQAIANAIAGQITAKTPHVETTTPEATPEIAPDDSGDNGALDE